MSIFGTQQLGQPQTGTNANMGAFSASTSQDKFMEFVKQVGAEMNTWEKSGLWLLSALCPMKDHPLLPGFEDTSYEELRVSAYLAKLDSTALQEYQKMLAEKLLRHKQLRDAFRSGTAEAVQALKDVFYNTSPGTSTDSSGSLFNKQGGSGGFGAGIFGSSQPASSSIFGATTGSGSGTSLFGTKPQGTSFGAVPAFGSMGAATTGSSVFGAPQQSNSLFAVTGSSAFGTPTSTAPSQQSTSLFGSNQASQGSVFGSAANTTSVFGNTGSVFGASQGSSASNTTSSLFGPSIAVNKNLFAASTTAGNGFDTQANSTSTSTFGSTNTSIFGGGSSFSDVDNSTTISNNNSIFGGLSQTQPSSLFGSTANPNSVFGGSNSSVSNTISNHQQSSVFGGMPSTVQPSSVFGNSTFTPTAPNQNVSSFGVQSLYGGHAAVTSSANQQPSPFGSSSTALPSSSQQSSLFGAIGAVPNTTIQQQSLFGGSSGTSASTAQQQSLFGGNTAISNSVPSLQSVFSSNTAVSSSNQAKPSILGDGPSSHQQPLLGPSSSGPLFGISSEQCASPADPSDERYTPLDQLTEEDRIQFRSGMFTYVPMVPPPRELCF